MAAGGNSYFRKTSGKFPRKITATSGKLPIYFLYFSFVQSQRGLEFRQVL
jgi:hypothetical protein